MPSHCLLCLLIVLIFLPLSLLPLSCCLRLESLNVSPMVERDHVTFANNHEFHTQRSIRQLQLIKASSRRHRKVRLVKYVKKDQHEAASSSHQHNFWQFLLLSMDSEFHLLYSHLLLYWHLLTPLQSITTHCIRTGCKVHSESLSLWRWWVRKPESRMKNSTPI